MQVTVEYQGVGYIIEAPEDARLYQTSTGLSLGYTSDEGREALPLELAIYCATKGLRGLGLVGRAPSLPVDRISHRPGT